MRYCDSIADNSKHATIVGDVARRTVTATPRALFALRGVSGSKRNALTLTSSILAFYSVTGDAQSPFVCIYYCSWVALTLLSDTLKLHCTCTYAKHCFVSQAFVVSFPGVVFSAYW